MRRSPQPLPPEAVRGQDVVPEAEDARLLDLLRAQARAVEQAPLRVCISLMELECFRLWACRMHGQPVCGAGTMQRWAHWCVLHECWISTARRAG